MLPLDPIFYALQLNNINYIKSIEYGWKENNWKLLNKYWKWFKLFFQMLEYEYGYI